MLWIVLWLVLIVAAAAVLAYVGRRVYRQAKALLAELSAASERLSELSTAMTATVPPFGADSSSHR